MFHADTIIIVRFYIHFLFVYLPGLTTGKNSGIATLGHAMFRIPRTSQQMIFASLCGTRTALRTRYYSLTSTLTPPADYSPLYLTNISILPTSSLAFSVRHIPTLFWKQSPTTPASNSPCSRIYFPPAKDHRSCCNRRCKRDVSWRCGSVGYVPCLRRRASETKQTTARRVYNCLECGIRKRKNEGTTECIPLLAL